MSLLLEDLELLSIFEFSQSSGERLLQQLLFPFQISASSLARGEETFLFTKRVSHFDQDEIDSFLIDNRELCSNSFLT